MKWLRSFTLVMKSNLRTIQEKIENPERLIHQLLADMEEELERVRQNVAEAIADEIQLGRRVESAREETERWLERAARALENDQEARSREALEQKLAAERRLGELENEYANQKEQTAELRAAVAELESKIRQARQRRTLLLARLSRADATSRIHSAVERASERSAFAEFRRLENRVERAEARVEAYKRLDGEASGASEADRTFDEDERRAELERQFAELKERLRAIDDDDDDRDDDHDDDEEKSDRERDA